MLNVAALVRSVAQTSTAVATEPGGDAQRRPSAAGTSLITLPRTYIVDQEIARGGMGCIVRAHDERLGRSVAVKQLLHPLAVARFMREARITARLEHPGIVPVHDAGTSDGQPFYAMKLVSGQSLDEAIRDAATLADRLALLPHAVAVAEAVAYAHSKGIIHRDIKPSNVVIGAFGETVVVDWGLAKDLREQGADQAEPVLASPENVATAFGEVLGTPGYMSPEQASGRSVDERSDVFALGGLLYRLLTGVHPHAAMDGTLPSDLQELKRVSSPVVPLDRRQGGLAPDLVAIVEKAMRADPRARYPSAAELAEDLRRFTTGQLVVAHRYRLSQLIRRWVARNRAFVVTAATALLAIATISTLSIHNIVRTSGTNERLLREAYFEQGRARFFDGDERGALPPLAAAYRMAVTDQAMRLLLEEADRARRAHVLTLDGHEGSVWQVAYSPDGALLATIADDRTVRIWDADTGAPRTTLPHSAASYHTLDFSADSRYLAYGGMEDAIHVWDVSARREVAAIPQQPFKVVFSPRDPVLAVVPRRGPPSLWRIPDGTLIGHVDLTGRGEALFCPDGSCLVSWTRGRVVVSDPRTAKPLATHALPPCPPFIGAVSQSGALFAVGCADGTLLLLRRDGTVTTRSEAAHAGFIGALAISLDETMTVTGSEDGSLRLWREDGAPPRLVDEAHRGAVMVAGFTPDGSRLVTGSIDGEARVWSASATPLGELSGHRKAIVAMAMRPDGQRLATASWDRSAKVWDLSSASMFVHADTAARASKLQLSFAPDGRRLAMGNAETSLSIVEVESGAVSCALRTTPTHVIWLQGDEIASAAVDGRVVEVWDARRCERVRSLLHPMPIAALSASPSDSRLATAAGDVVRIWSGDRIEASFSGYPGEIQRVGIEGDLVYAATGKPATITVDALTSPAKGRIVLRAGFRNLSQISVDEERGWLIAASEDQTAYIWDIASGELVRRLHAGGPLYAVRPSLDGAFLLGVGGLDLTLWDRATGERLGYLEGHDDLAVGGEFIAEQLFLSVGTRGTAIVWDVLRRRPLLKFENVSSLAVSGDRRTVALVGPGGVRLWSPRAPVPAADVVQRVERD